MARTVLVTGCSSGIGRATAIRFREAGWTVYATARDERDLRDLGARGCLTAELDVTDGAAAAAVVDRVHAEQGHLDCLVNNAGYGQVGPVEDVPMDAVRRQFEVNTFGPLRLIRAALPRMRERGRGRVVNVTAGFGGLTLPGIGVYTASKFALESATDALRQEVSRFGVDVVKVQPGLVATDFYERALAELDAADGTEAYADVYRALESSRIVGDGPPGINDPERVAETILDAATDPNPAPAYRVGALAKLGTYGGSAVRGRLRDRATRLGIQAAASDTFHDRLAGSRRTERRREKPRR